MDRHRTIWFVVFASVAVLLIVSCCYSEFDHDEIEHLHASWLIAKGFVPFVDFMEQHHPVLWYVISPLTQLFESPRMLVFAARLLDLSALAAFLWIFALMVRVVFPRADWKWPTILLLSSFTFTRNMLEVRPDPWMNLFIFTGLLFWFRHILRGGWRDAVASGISLGMAVVMLQKAAVVLFIIIIASIILSAIHMRERRRAIELAKGTVLLVAAACVPLLAFYVLIARSGRFEQFVFWNYTFNRFFYLNAELTEHFFILTTLARSLAHNFLIWIVGAAGFIVTARDIWRNRRNAAPTDDVKMVIIAIAFCYFIFLARSRFPFAQYFIVLLPFLALLSCSVTFFEKTRRRQMFYRGAIVAMMVEMLVISLAYRTNANQVMVQNYILKNTGDGDAIFASSPYHPIFRRDASYFWYNATMISGVAKKADHPEAVRGLDLEMARWADDPPSYVFIGDGEEKYQPYGWKARSVDYVRTDVEGLYRFKP